MIQPQPVPSQTPPPTKKHVMNFFKDKIRLGVIFFIFPFLMSLTPRNVFLLPLELISPIAPLVSAVLFALKASEEGVKTTKKIELFVASEGILIFGAYLIFLGMNMCFDECPHLAPLHQAFLYFLLFVYLVLIIFVLFKAISILKKKPQISNNTPSSFQ